MISKNGPEGPDYFLKYFEYAYKGRNNEDGPQIAGYYAHLYYSENPNLEDINFLIEYTDMADLGSVGFDLRASLRRWREQILSARRETNPTICVRYR